MNTVKRPWRLQSPHFQQVGSGRRSPLGRTAHSLVVFPMALLVVILAGCEAGNVAPASSAGAAALAPITLTFQRHMDFFSKETQQPAIIDPQMFVVTPGASAGTGPQNIPHAAGVAPVQATAPDSTSLLDAQGKSLDVTLGSWKAATGQATLTCQTDREMLSARFNKLVPDASYSLFDVHLSVQGAGRFTPLTTSNSFRSGADGAGQLTVSGISPCLGSDDAVLLVWNSDGKPHGASLGSLGVDAHNQLIAPLTSR